MEHEPKQIDICIVYRLGLKEVTCSISVTLPFTSSGNMYDVAGPISAVVAGRSWTTKRRLGNFWARKALMCQGEPPTSITVAAGLNRGPDGI